ncbi:hypothetical protein [uncultured Croceitalea sp.]|uniref:hypothetical protein n=1 Tax=uncultured Croceitalea sp. TaxID=1798908 RepID=UPI0033061952
MKKKQKEYLSDLIDESYGSPSRLAQHLDMGVEMLFYLEEDTFDKREVQSVVSALKGIILALRMRE